MTSVSSTTSRSSSFNRFSVWQRVKSDERYVEIPFALKVPAAELGLDGPPESLLHGTIDLVFRERNEWFVVDYKTDAIANRLDSLTEYYAPQVRLYANFWSRLTAAPARGGLFFVDGCVERWWGERRSASIAGAAM